MTKGEQIMAKSAKAVDKVWGLARISLGLTFLWAFFDKLIGLGFTTCRNVETSAIETMCSSAWLEGGSPTTGFLEFGTKGTFADFFQGLAGNSFVDWMFMLGLLGLGIGLTFGIAMKISVIGGVALLVLMWLAALWPEHHPFLDEHLIYSVVLVGLLLVNNKQALGLGRWWKKQEIVKNNPWLI